MFKGKISLKIKLIFVFILILLILLVGCLNNNNGELILKGSYDNMFMIVWLRDVGEMNLYVYNFL